MKQNSQDKNTRLIAIILLAITSMTFNSVSAEDEPLIKSQVGYAMQGYLNSVRDSVYKKISDKHTVEQISKIQNSVIGSREIKYLNPKRVKKILLADWLLSIKPADSDFLFDNPEFILSINDVNLDSRGNGSFTYRLYDTNNTAAYYSDSLGFINNGIIYLALPYINAYSMVAVSLSKLTGLAVFERHSTCNFANDKKSYTCTLVENSTTTFPIEFRRL